MVQYEQVVIRRITPWHIPDFGVGRYEARLRALHARLASGDPLEVTCHRFLLTAQSPG